jgi:NAD(P)-dependent dehydrogenase (short-subunit alcohol dehydrogenase family)
MRIDGAAAIVTGGASGLGEAAARLLASLGAKVSIFDLDEVLGIRLADEIGAFYQYLDVSDDTCIEAALEQAHHVHGVARILVGCAGISAVSQTIDNAGASHPSAIFSKVIEINLLGTFFILARFAARLAAAEPLGEERGIIINTSSIAAYDGQARQAAYAASKAGVAALTLPVALDLAKHKIRVMTIAPGMFRTPMVNMLSEEQKDALGRNVPFPNRLGKPREFALLVQSIIENSMLNGAVIRLDGAHRLG